MADLPIDFNGLNSTVHGPLRLGILTALRMDGPLDFTTIKHRLKAADGVLGMNLRKLEDEAYITCSKSFVGRRPKSTYQITEAGITALADYLAAMRRLLETLDSNPAE
ncbi:MAG: transcriptional regulator [Candidatus Sumerlaeia bacterium]